MKISPAEKRTLKKSKEKLGKKIRRLRESQGYALRSFALIVDVPYTNLKYIEDGVNAPTARVYKNIIDNLDIDNDTRKKMDSLYTIIRETPPPDVCDIIIEHDGMNDVLRGLKNKTLSAQQLGMIKELFDSFETETIEGENENG